MRTPRSARAGRRQGQEEAGALGRAAASRVGCVTLPRTHLDPAERKLPLSYTRQRGV